MAAISESPKLFWETAHPELKYNVKGQIGEGAFSKIYHVTGPRPDEQDFALKVIKRAAFDPNENIRDLVKQEVQLLDMARGAPHILKVFKILSLDSRCFPQEQQPSSGESPPEECAILMELGKGQSLLEFECALSANTAEPLPPLPIDKINDIARKALETLAALSNKGIVHGDITPQNFLYDTDGTLTLIDFGFAQKAGKGEDSFTGTTWYASPEAFMRKNLFPSSDMWSLGAVLFEIVTQRVLFKTEPKYCNHNKPEDHFHLMNQQMGGLPPHTLISSYALEMMWFEIAKNETVKIVVPPSKWMRTRIDDVAKLVAARSPQAPMWQTRLSMYMQQRGASTTDIDFFLNLIGAMIKYNPEDRITAEDALRRFFTISEEKAG